MFIYFFISNNVLLRKRGYIMFMMVNTKQPKRITRKLYTSMKRGNKIQN